MQQPQIPISRPNIGELATSDKKEMAELETAVYALQGASTVGEVKEIRDKAEAVRNFAKNARLGLAMQNKAAILKLQAERKAGKLLKAMSLRGGDRRSNGHSDRLKLGDLGISQNQSKRWQQEAAVSDEEFQQFVRSARDKGRELTSASLLRFANRQQKHFDPSVQRSIRLPQNGKPPSSAMMEDIEELYNHNKMIDSIVAPLYDSVEPVLLRGAEQKMLRRVIRESSALLAHLRKQLDHTIRQNIRD